MSAYESIISGKPQLCMDDIIRTATGLVPEAYRGAPYWHPELDHGKGVLRSEDALNCYLAAYGLMHAAKLRTLLKNLPLSLIANGFEVVDWGCGQGIAAVCLLDWLEHAAPGLTPGRVTLVDASALALRRAGLHLRAKLGRRADICCIQAELPATSGADGCRGRIALRGERVVLHLLSNVLDLPGLSYRGLARHIAGGTARNYVACSGHYTSLGQIYSVSFSQAFRRVSTLYERAQDNSFGTLPNGYRFGCDLRLFGCGAAA